MSVSRSFLSIGILAALFSICTLLFFHRIADAVLTNNQAPQNQLQNVGVAQQANLSAAAVDQTLPIRLTIPKINVDAPIEYVGLSQDGAMDAPKGPLEVAWFNLGPRPGETGNAVLAGHEGWKDGIPAVFDTLHALRKGDRLYVEDEKGLITTFVVRELRTFGKDEDATDVFSSTDGKSHLNLITCEGSWNKTEKSYSHRLVVFADKEAK